MIQGGSKKALKKKIKREKRQNLHLLDESSKRLLVSPIVEPLSLHCTDSQRYQMLRNSVFSYADYSNY